MTANVARDPPAAPERSEFDGWEDWYSRRNYREMPWFSPRPSPWLVRAVRERWIPRGASVIDVGCGTGSNVLWLVKKGFRTVGVDLSPTAISIASSRARKARIDAEFRVASATELPFRPGSFASALDTGCFHSLPLHSRVPYAKEVHRILRPGGAFLLTWIPREVRTEMGPPHRPSLAETAEVFEPWFVFTGIERHDSGSSGGWTVKRERVGRCTARLERRRTTQPPPW